jgi:hypothetical protein
MEALPFIFRNKPGEAGETSGICRLDETTVVIEWRKVSLIKRHEKNGTVRLPLEELESVTYEGGLFRACLDVRPRTLDVIQGVPGRHASGALLLWVTRRDRRKAKELASSIDFALSEYRIDRLGRSIGL